MKSSVYNRFLLRIPAFVNLPVLVITGFSLGSLHGATLFWDGTTQTADGVSSGGTGTWSNSAVNWDNATAIVAWPGTGNDASFGGTVASTVTLASLILADNILLTGTAAYNITTTSGNSLTLSGGITQTISGNPLNVISGAGGLSLSGGGNHAFTITNGVLNITAPLSGTGTVSLGAGTLGLGGTSTFTGKFAINGGALLINGDAALGAIPAAPVADSITLNGGFLTAGSPNNGTGNFNNATPNLAANRGITVGSSNGSIRVGYGGSGHLTINGVISGPGALTKTDGGDLILKGTNTFTGGLTISSGRVAIAADSALGDPAAPLTFNGGTLLDAASTNGNGFTDGGTFSLNPLRNINMTGNGTIQVGYAGVGTTLTVPGNFSGTGNLNKTDGGTLLLSGTNTPTGTVTASAGVLGFIKPASLYNGDTAQWTPAKVIVNSGGAVAVTVGGANDFSDAQVNTLFTNLLTVNNNGLKTGSSVGIDTRNATATVTYSHILADSTGTGGGAVGFAKLGSGTLVLDQPNTYTGSNAVRGGILSVAAIADSGVSNIGFSATNALTILGGTLRYTGNSASTTGRPLRFDNSLSNVIEVSDAAGSLTFTGVANGSANNPLTKTGPGTLITGGTGDNVNCRLRVDAGTLVLGKTSSGSVHAVGSGGNLDYALVVAGGVAKLGGSGQDQIFNNSSVNVTGGTFDLAGLSEEFDGLFGTGGIITNNVAASHSDITLGANNSNGTPNFSGVIADGAGTVSITKNGTGRQILSGPNTYTGETFVTGGVLQVDGSLSAASVVTMINSSLQGTGTIHGPVTTNNAGAISPAGTAVGTLNVGTTTLAGFLEATVSGATGDLLNVTGDLTVTDAMLNVSQATPATAPKYVLVKYTGTLTGTLTVAGSLPAGYSLTHDTTAKEIYISNGATGNFATYMDGFPGLSPADKLPGADPDHDGLSNLVEYALAGFNPTVPNPKAGTLAGNVVSFSKNPLAVSNGDVTYAIEQSSTLGVAPDPWTVVVPTANDSSTISYTLPTGQAKVFTRLRIIKN